MHGHLYLLDTWVQSSLPGLLPGEDGAALAADLSGGRANSRCSRCKAWRGKKMDGFRDDYGTVLLMSYWNCFIIFFFTPLPTLHVKGLKSTAKPVITVVSYLVWLLRRFVKSEKLTFVMSERIRMIWLRLFFVFESGAVEFVRCMH